VNYERAEYFCLIFLSDNASLKTFFIKVDQKPI
jgi:hypothetical protein